VVVTKIRNTLGTYTRYIYHVTPSIDNRCI